MFGAVQPGGQTWGRMSIDQNFLAAVVALWLAVTTWLAVMGIQNPPNSDPGKSPAEQVPEA